MLSSAGAGVAGADAESMWSLRDILATFLEAFLLCMTPFEAALSNADMRLLKIESATAKSFASTA